MGKKKNKSKENIEGGSNWFTIPSYKRWFFILNSLNHKEIKCKEKKKKRKRNKIISILVNLNSV